MLGRKLIYSARTKGLKMATDTVAAEALSSFAPFVQQLIAAGDFKNEAEVYAEGLRLLQAREQFRAEVKIGFDQLDQGLRIPGEQVFAELRRRIGEKTKVKD